MKCYFSVNSTVYPNIEFQLNCWKQRFHEAFLEKEISDFQKLNISFSEYYFFKRDRLTRH